LILGFLRNLRTEKEWFPAFAGMTGRGGRE
jgi:hypothetical protein